MRAQTTATSAAVKPADDETIILSPFVVEATEDQGYAAKDTLAGTRVRTELRDVASAISVVTQQFLKDTGAKNSSDLLVYTPSTEVAGIRGNFSGVAGTGVYAENTVSTSTRVRGLDQADTTRDYFLTDIPWDGFNVGRVDLQRGPNSILFGIGSPAGIINTSVNDASFKTAYNFENRIDQYGSNRNQINLNQELIKGVLAIRFAAVKDNALYEQKPAFNDATRYYGALRFDPKLFGETNHTSVRLKFEKGDVKANNPRQNPPVDEITPWFRTGTDAYGNPGLNKLTLNQFSAANPNPSGTPLPGATGGTLASNTFEFGGWAQSRSYWPDIINYYEGTDFSKNNNPLAAPSTGTPIKTIAAEPNLNKGLNGNNIKGVTGFRPYGIPSASQYYPYVGFAGTAYPGNPVPGGPYYADAVLTDPTIFNFYKNLLDGPNKHEWQHWTAFNAAVDQSFFNDRLAFELAFDHQKYSQGTNQWMTGSNYAISIDVNQTYADGTPNANVGRPYAANAASNPNAASDTTRDTVRLTPTYELRSEDLLGNTEIAKILGKHNFTGIYERNTIVKNTISWAEFATTPQYIIDNFANTPGNPVQTGQLGSNRSFEWLVYLGPSLTSKASASGSNLANIKYLVEPPANQTAYNFNATWNRPTAPGAAGYVNPTAPYTWISTQSGALNTGTEIDNPANYVGWTQEPIQWMRADNPSDYPSLVTSAIRTRFRDISEGFTWQGHMLDGDFVPAFGWRKDKLTSYQTPAFQDQTTGFTSLNYVDDQSSRDDVSGISRSWGAVYHLPKSLVGKLPGDMTISVLFNHSDNYKADAQRRSLSGVRIPNAFGKTTEYGIVVTALHDKLSLKVNWFKTQVNGATLAETNGNSIGGLGNNSYFIADGVIWGYAWATALQDGLRGQTSNSSYWDYSQADAGSNPSLGGSTSAAYIANNQKNTAITDAWLKIPLPATFFTSYNLSPKVDATIGARTGNLRDSYPNGYNDANGPQPGGGSNFGNHQILSDNLSKGTEIELSAQPTKNWNLTLNYSRINAKHTHIDQDAQDFIGAMTKFMNGPGGQVREWFNGGGALGTQWNSSITLPFTVQLNELGHQVPEISPWRLNLVSTYTFDHGPVKGVFFGGALRVDAARIIGYAFDPLYRNSNAGDPNYAAVAAVTVGGLNVDKPFIGKNERHVDGWIGYSRKLTNKITWRIQANIRAIGEKDSLIAARVQPDGSLALARISQGMGWQLTNSFDF